MCYSGATVTLSFSIIFLSPYFYPSLPIFHSLFFVAPFLSSFGLSPHALPFPFAPLLFSNVHRCHGLHTGATHARVSVSCVRSTVRQGTTSRLPHLIFARLCFSIFRLMIASLHNPPFPHFFLRTEATQKKTHEAHQASKTRDRQMGCCDIVRFAFLTSATIRYGCERVWPAAPRFEQQRGSGLVRSRGQAGQRVGRAVPRRRRPADIAETGSHGALLERLLDPKMVCLHRERDMSAASGKGLWHWERHRRHRPRCILHARSLGFVHAEA